jgi:hypothetical protein
VGRLAVAAPERPRHVRGVCCRGPNHRCRPDHLGKECWPQTARRREPTAGARPHC